jgi:adenine deaminase
MDRVLRHAISQGLDPFSAIQMATINTAEHFGVSKDMGLIAPGRYADILLVSDLAKLDVDVVIAKGIVAAEKGELKIEIPIYPYPDWATGSVNLGKELTAKDFILPAKTEGKVTANVIGVSEGDAVTQHLELEVAAANGEVGIDLEKDILKIALVERHKGTGGVQVGLVKGFGFTEPCGIASTVAHDSHHMVVVGTNEVDMAKAANELARMGGGQVVVKDGEVIGMVELPIAGLMSNQRADVVAKKAATVLEGFRACGCSIVNPNMQLSLIALVVIPELRISDLGLVDVTKFDFIPVLNE